MAKKKRKKLWRFVKFLRSKGIDLCYDDEGTALMDVNVDNLIHDFLVSEI